MTHPSDDLLAAYVDGSLSQEDRAAVDTHLATCARCTQDVAQAAAARSALRAIPEVPIPDDLKIPTAAEAEIAASTARRRSTAPAWQRWIGPAAAVAAAALVLTLVLPKLGGSNDDSSGRAESNAAASGVQVDASPVPLEIRSDDYTPDTLTDLAGQTAAGIRAPDANGPGSAAAEATPKLGDAARGRQGHRVHPDRLPRGPRDVGAAHPRRLPRVARLRGSLRRGSGGGPGTRHPGRPRGGRRRVFGADLRGRSPLAGTAGSGSRGNTRALPLVGGFPP